MNNFSSIFAVARYVCLGLAVFTAGCMGFGRSVPAPVEERPVNKTKSVGATQPKAATPLPASVSDQVKATTSPVENSNRSGYYTVKPGDTLIRIGLDQGQNWRDIIRWNNIENPNVIEVGQVLRIAPPTGDTAQEVAITKPVQIGTISALPEEKKSPSAVEPPAVATIKSEGSDDSFQLTWPAQGAISSAFDDSKNKGIDISGKAGDAVWAAADGKVVYAGSGLRGYGNLVILKHNNTFLTAYAHNQTLLVREDQSVKRGQKIAEMGNSDSEQVKLHFELRRLGKPVDPLKFLPAR